MSKTVCLSGFEWRHSKMHEQSLQIRFITAENCRPRVPDLLEQASLAHDHQPGLPVIPVWLQFVGAAEPRPRSFTAHYLMEGCMIRWQRQMPLSF